MGQLDTESLAVVGVRHERLAVAVVARALAHVLQTRLVVHRRVDLAVARLEYLRPQTVAQPVSIIKNISLFIALILKGVSVAFTCDPF